MRMHCVCMYSNMHLPGWSLNGSKEWHHQNHNFLCKTQYYISVELKKIARRQRYRVDVELALAAEAKQAIHVENKARVRRAADGTVSIHV